MYEKYKVKTYEDLGYQSEAFIFFCYVIMFSEESKNTYTYILKVEYTICYLIKIRDP